jgi:hypothetical protein
VRQRAHEVVEADLARPVETERLREVAQPPEPIAIHVGHHPEHAGVRRQQRVGDGEVGRQ